MENLFNRQIIPPHQFAKAMFQFTFQSVVFQDDRRYGKHGSGEHQIRDDPLVIESPSWWNRKAVDWRVRRLIYHSPGYKYGQERRDRTCWTSRCETWESRAGDRRSFRWSSRCSLPCWRTKTPIRRWTRPSAKRRSPKWRAKSIWPTLIERRPIWQRPHSSTGWQTRAKDSVRSYSLASYRCLNSWFQSSWCLFSCYRRETVVKRAQPVDKKLARTHWKGSAPYNWAPLYLISRSITPQKRVQTNKKQREQQSAATGTTKMNNHCLPGQDGSPTLPLSRPSVKTSWCTTHLHSNYLGAAHWKSFADALGTRRLFRRSFWKYANSSYIIREPLQSTRDSFRRCSMNNSSALHYN